LRRRLSRGGRAISTDGEGSTISGASEVGMLDDEEEATAGADMATTEGGGKKGEGR
jgi:hypothetical protein